MHFVMQWMAPLALMMFWPLSSQSIPITRYPGRDSRRMRNPVVSYSSR